MKIKKKIRVVLFDFDGTLSADDANLAFWRYCFRHSARPWVFSPVVLIGLVLMCLSFLTPKSKKRVVTGYGIMWRQMVRIFLTNKMIARLLPGFVAEHKRKRFGWAKERVATERAAGNFVICISGSSDYLLDALIDDMAFDAVICSVMDPKYPWKFDLFCWGANKVLALAGYVNMIFSKNPDADDVSVMKSLDDIDVVRAYSDSKNDLPMMTLARERVWIDRKTGLRK